MSCVCSKKAPKEWCQLEWLANAGGRDAAGRAGHGRGASPQFESECRLSNGLTLGANPPQLSGYTPNFNPSRNFCELICTNCGVGGFLSSRSFGSAYGRICSRTTVRARLGCGYDRSDVSMRRHLNAHSLLVITGRRVTMVGLHRRSAVSSRLPCLKDAGHPNWSGFSQGLLAALEVVLPVGYHKNS